jgi:hypothetical protein
MKAASPRGARKILTKILLLPDLSHPQPTTAWRYAHRQQTSRKHYELVVERWQEIRRLHEAGAEVADIARKLGTSRPTVYRYKDLTEPPEFGQHRRRGSVKRSVWVPYILKRWEEGCRNGKKLFRERFENKATPTASPTWDAWSPSSGEQMD